MNNFISNSDIRLLQVELVKIRIVHIITLHLSSCPYIVLNQ